jgi:3-deoxy-D-manno-octulosonic acid kinase
MQTKSALTLPAGFIEQRFHNWTWWVKAGWEETLPACLGPLQSVIPHRQPAIHPKGGRGTVQRIELSERGNIIVRHYQRGGFVRHFVRNLYWDRPPRPLVELICTETARQRGVPTVEVLGAGVEWVGVGLYHGTFITREAEGCINLWEWLHGRPTGKVRETMVAAVAQAIASMHHAGIAHADLNLTNILVQIATDSPAVLLIDFDRGRVFPDSLPPRQRERHLRRLHSSLNKLDPGGLLSSPTDLEIFCRAYRQHSPC